jgi:hypothetical protein
MQERQADKLEKFQFAVKSFFGDAWVRCFKLD